MSCIAARIAAAFLIALLVLPGTSTAVSPLQPGGATDLTIHTAYWPLIQIRPPAKPKSPDLQPGLQNTGSARPAVASLGTSGQIGPEQTSIAAGTPESIAREVYVQGKFILPITQQPAGENAYVSTEPKMITQFGMPTRNGVTGLLAHNYLSGALFYRLEVGEEIHVLYADRQIRNYRISGVLSFQKLHPADSHSDYLDLQTGNTLSTAEVFRKVYRGAPHLTLQTCLERNGNLSWGLYFVIASPVNKGSG